VAALHDHPLVVLIDSRPGMAERLLVEHRDDGTGRCASCRIGGQAGNQRWPCLLRRCAELAVAPDGVPEREPLPGGPRAS
jgi:hypothetical protein